VDISVAAKSDVGRRRKNNEDSYLVQEDLNLFMVADGMGGHSAGEVASKLAVDVICENTEKARGNEAPVQFGKYDSMLSKQANQLMSSIRMANQVIWEAGQSHDEYKGMGTTVAAAYVLDRTVIIAHVGDSRIYRIRDDTIEQLSEDHSVISQQIRMGLITKEEAASSPMKGIITEALGARDTVLVDVDEAEVLEGDYYLLCSDGLSDLVDENEMLETLLRHPEDLRQVCEDLISMANERAGHDNITVVVVNIQNVNPCAGLLYRIAEWGVALLDVLVLSPLRRVL